MRKSGRAWARRWRAPRESRSSPTAPTTTISPGPSWRWAAMSAAASAPFASQAPRPWRRSPSNRTGSLPSTVSMCPRNMMEGGPSPIRAMPFPAASACAVKPRDRALSMNRCTAPASCPEGLYSSTSAVRIPTSSIRQGPPEHVNRARPLRFWDHERREQSDHARSSADREHAFLLHRLEDRRRLAAELDADHESEPADFADRWRVEAAQRRDRVSPESLRAFPQPLPHRVVDRGGAGRAGERIAAERRVVAAFERALDLPRRQGRADRHAPREGLRQREEVGLDAPPFDGEESARAAHARLDLVEDQERTRAVADLAGGRQVFRRRDMDAAFALDRLEEDGGGVPVDGVAQRVDVVEGHVHEARDQGLERFPEILPPRRAEGSHRPPVEAAHRRDDLRAARRRPGELLLRGRPERRADVDQLPRLRGDRLDDCGVAVAEVAHAERGAAIDVLAAVLVPEARHRSAHERRRALRRACELCGPCLDRDHEITVPIPSSARSTGSGCREEAITTRATPPSRASCAVISFFFIRPYAKSMNVRSCARGTSGMRVNGLLGSRKRPGTFVRRMRVSASIATATCAAIRSASALMSSPRAVTPGGEMTGTYPASNSSWISPVFTRSTVPE